MKYETIHLRLTLPYKEGRDPHKVLSSLLTEGDSLYIIEDKKGDCLVAYVSRSFDLYALEGDWKEFGWCAADEWQSNIEDHLTEFDQLELTDYYGLHHQPDQASAYLTNPL